jgi:hypothetical protein
VAIVIMVVMIRLFIVSLLFVCLSIDDFSSYLVLDAHGLFF